VKDACASVVGVDIRGQNAAQMAFVADYDVVEAFNANRTDHAFNGRSAKVSVVR
jgi:hypothetical protein